MSTVAKMMDLTTKRAGSNPGMEAPPGLTISTASAGGGVTGFATVAPIMLPASKKPAARPKWTAGYLYPSVTKINFESLGPLTADPLGSADKGNRHIRAQGEDTGQRSI